MNKIKGLKMKQNEKIFQVINVLDKETACVP